MCYAKASITYDEAWYYAPQAMLQIRKNEDTSLNRIAITTNDFWDGLKSSFQKNDYDLFLEEDITVNGIKSRLLGFNVTLHGCKLMTMYMTIYYENLTNSLISIGLICGQKTDFDFLTDFKNMLKTIK